MSENRRIKRMTRAKGRKVPGLNLVSLMDVFTILVFFLLVNQSDTKDLPSPDDVELPESIAEIAPKKTIVIMISKDRKVLVNEEEIASVEQVMSLKENFVPAITELLNVEKKKFLASQAFTSQKLLSVTIMGDKNIEFSVLKKIMASCTVAGYEQISLAILQKAGQEPG